MPLSSLLNLSQRRFYLIILYTSQMCKKELCLTTSYTHAHIAFEKGAINQEISRCCFFFFFIYEYSVPVNIETKLRTILRLAHFCSIFAVSCLFYAVMHHQVYYHIL